VTDLPFEGIVVADFGWIFAVPHATAWLGALGANVIRVETATAPDLVRFLSGTDGQLGINRSGIYNAINFSKRSIAVNLARPEGAEVARRLIKRSDIAIENFTVGNMDKFGLGYEALRAIKSDLIMLSGTPLGQTGPYARTVGFGPTTQAFAGICHLTGYPDGFPCGIGGTWPDFAVGTAMVFALLAALHHRDRTGEGQYIDLSMAELVTSMLPEAMMDVFINGRDSGPIGNRDECMAPHGVFPVKGDDRWIAIAIATDDEFGRLCDLLGVPNLASNPLYSRLATRLQNVETLETEIAARTRNYDRDELVANLRAAGLAAGPVNRAEDIANDPAYKASPMPILMTHKECGSRITPGLAVGFSAIEPNYTAAPILGEHTDQILEGLLGYKPSEIARLRSENVLT
jgi:benzylsuccinate CoA-transferase BbsF subunit